MIHLARTNDRRGHERFTEHPSERDLCVRDTSSFGDFGHTIHNVKIRRVRVQGLREWIGFGTFGQLLTGTVAISGQHASSQRTPRQHAHAQVQALRHHLAFLLAVQEVVMVLHRNELRPMVAFGGALHFCKLPREHARGSDVTHATAAHDIVQRLHRFFDRRVRIETVNLIQIQVIGAQTFQARIDCRKNVLPRESLLVRAILARREKHFAGDHDLIASRQLAQQCARDLFAAARRVRIRRVKKIDARLERPFDERFGLVNLERPGAKFRIAIGHHAEGDVGDFQTGLTEAHVIHGRSITRVKVVGCCVGNPVNSKRPAVAHNAGRRSDSSLLVH